MTKEVFCVSADFNQDLGYIAVALIDREIFIYKVKMSGTKVNMINCFSFHVKFASSSAVSTINIEKYVTNSRPIIIIGSQSGEIVIYYLDIND
jgi:hypothetical protein